MSIILGIDPGVHTGVAIYRAGQLTELRTIGPHEIDALLTELQPRRVVFEDSRLQSHTWSKVPSRAAAAKMARNVGEIDAWCRLITAICERLGIAAHGISPLGKGAKVKAEKFASITGWTKSSNEHSRDAAMVAWKYRGASNA